MKLEFSERIIFRVIPNYIEREIDRISNLEVLIEGVFSKKKGGHSVRQ